LCIIKSLLGFNYISLFVQGALSDIEAKATLVKLVRFSSGASTEQATRSQTMGLRWI